MMKKIVVMLPDEIEDNMEVQGQIVETATPQPDGQMAASVNKGAQATGAIVNAAASTLTSGAKLVGATAGTTVNLGFGLLNYGLGFVAGVLQAFSDGVQSGLSPSSSKSQQ